MCGIAVTASGRTCTSTARAHPWPHCSEGERLHRGRGHVGPWGLWGPQWLLGVKAGSLAGPPSDNALGQLTRLAPFQAAATLRD